MPKSDQTMFLSESDSNNTAAPPPKYSASHPKSVGHANNTPWDTSGFSFPPSTNTLDAEKMPSSQAEAARQKSAAVMAALRAGVPGAADAAMGDSEQQGGQGIVPLRWLKGKFSGGKREIKTVR